MRLANQEYKCIIASSLFLLASASCVADAARTKAINSESCMRMEELLQPLSVFIDKELKEVILSDSDSSMHSTTANATVELSVLIKCSTKLTELELNAGSAIDRKKCDPFPISVTLTGLQDTLTELHSCKLNTCTTDRITYIKNTIQLQRDRLIMLHKKCEGFNRIKKSGQRAAKNRKNRVRVTFPHFNGRF